MFAQLNASTARRQGWLRMGSLAVHGALLAWFLHSPEPLLLNPVSIAIGHNGSSLTRLYWPSKLRDDSTHSSSDSASQRYRHQRLSHESLVWKTPLLTAKQAHNPAPAKSEDSAPTQTLSALGHGVQAGLPYGTLNRGQLYGEEIRPALPTQTFDPVVFPWQLPTNPGNEVIEITIDELGNITNKTVLHSLGPDIDTKCLAALENWHFQPATRNGRPIPSKQDAIFPFKPRGSA